MINYTIIIPHYNLPDLIIRCLNSIPIRDDLQILIVDDCSSKSEEMRKNVGALGRTEIQIISTPYNGGAGLARNIGLDNAVGKWIIFADADDLLADNAFDVFDKYKNSSAESIIFNSVSVMSDDITKPSQRSPRKRLFEDYNSGKNDDIRYDPAQPWGRMIKRDLIERHHIRFPEVRYSEDMYFAVCSSVYAQEFLVVDEIVYIVTEREGSNANTLSNTTAKPSLKEVTVRYDEMVRSYIFMKKYAKRIYELNLIYYRSFYTKNYPLHFLKNLISHPKKYKGVYFLELCLISKSLLRPFKKIVCKLNNNG